jgi:hypothetical protein
MPKCFYCKKSTPGPQLQHHGGELACKRCRTPREVRKMSEKQKPVASLQIFEDGKNIDGETNYRIEATVQVGGLNLSLEKTTDEIREYFTAKKVKAEAARTLKVAPKSRVN